MADVKLLLNGMGAGSLIVDGLDISAQVGGIQLNATPGQQPELLLRVPGVEVAVMARVALAPATAALLRDLGWTPPAETDKEA